MESKTTDPQVIRIQDLGRTAISRRQSQAIAIVDEVECGENTAGWCACCTAPACCSTLASLPCFQNPEYITLRYESSKYIYLRENSLEWNEPKIILNRGPCCGVDPCMYSIEDDVSVLYFDNPVFENINDKTRTCNTVKTCICGGRGERIQLDSRCCCGTCYYSPYPCCFVPTCWPHACTPCHVYRREIFVKDAQKSIFGLSKALDSFNRR